MVNHYSLRIMNATSPGTQFHIRFDGEGADEPWAGAQSSRSREAEVRVQIRVEGGKPTSDSTSSRGSTGLVDIV